MSGTKRSPLEDNSLSKRSKLSSVNSPAMSGHSVGASKNGLNSKLPSSLTKPPTPINHSKPTTKKLVIKNLKGTSV